jgi:hypothetical protein
MGSASHRIKVTGHPGSSREDIENEPDWGSASHEHRVGYHNRQGRIPGVTHSGDEKLEEEQFVREALKEQEQLEDRISKGQLINFRDVLLNQEVSRVECGNMEKKIRSVHVLLFKGMGPGRLTCVASLGFSSSTTRCSLGGMAVCGQ